MPRLGGALDVPQVTDPASPASGRQFLYFKSDGILYSKSSSGVVAAVGAAGTTTASLDGGATPDETYSGLSAVSGGSTAPNMVTTDTAQTLTGVKTFGVGKLLMANAAGTVFSEPYSDTNPPDSLERLLLAAAPVAPPAGESVEYTTDGKSLRMLASDGTNTVIGPYLSAGVEFDLTQDWTTTTPASPLTGITIFARHRARRMLAQVGPSGLDTSLQPALFSNRISILTAPQGSATETQVGMVAARTAVPVAGPALAATSFYTRMAKLRYSTAATAGAGNGPRTASAAAGLAYFLSNLANTGGFFFVARFGIGVNQTGSRGFVGLSTSTVQYPALAEPSAGVNQIGFGWDSTSTTMYLMQNGATAAPANHFNLGAPFPTKTSGVDFYECRLFAPSGNGSTVNWSITRLNTNDFLQGSVNFGLPAIDVFMAAHIGLSNGTSAAIASLDVQSLYIETDN